MTEPEIFVAYPTTCIAKVRFTEKQFERPKIPLHVLKNHCNGSNCVSRREFCMLHAGIPGLLL